LLHVIFSHTVCHVSVLKNEFSNCSCKVKGVIVRFRFK
jgi:hypothetical protein